MNRKQVILNEIKTKAELLAKKIDYPLEQLPTHNYFLEGEQIEIDKYGDLYYVFIERGEPVIRELAVDVDDLLFKVFSSVASVIASKYELDVRNENEDFRRKMFAKREDLLGQLNEHWKLREQNRNQQILKLNPFDDNATLRIKYYQELKAQNIPNNESWLKACEKYPQP